MSDVLFSRPDPRRRVKLAALAAVCSLLLLLGSAWLGLSFVGVVGRDVPVTVQVTTLGDSLGVNSSVKFRSLRIGRVIELGDGADAGGAYTVRVVIQREYADQVPSDVVARVLPGTIFGADYVDLVPPTAAGQTVPVAAVDPGPLVAGQIVGADTSAPTIRLMDTFSATQRILGALDPAAMDQALSQLAAALDGRGEQVGGFITRADSLLAQAHRAEPALYADLELIARNLTTFSELEPALARSLRDSLPAARTIAAKARSTSTLLAGTSRLSKDMTVFLDRNGALLVAMLDAVMPVYEAFVGGIGPFSTILRMAIAVLDNGAFAVKDGAIQMRAQFDVALVNPYTAADCPRYGKLQGSNCR